MNFVPVFKKIDPDDKRITEFYTHRLTQANQSNFSSSFDINIFKGKFSSRKIAIGDAAQTATEATSSNGKFEAVNYYSINHLFYKRADEPYEVFGSHDTVNHRRFLYATASIITIPYGRVGERIKPGSFKITDKSTQPLFVGSYVDNAKGQIIDLQINSSSFANDNLKLYLGFNEKFNTASELYDGSIYEFIIAENNVQYVPGIISTGLVTQATGIAARFNGATSFIDIEHTPELDFKKTDDFAVSLWINAPVSQSAVVGDTNVVLTKHGKEKRPGYNTLTGATVSQYLTASLSPKRPYQINWHNHTSATPGSLDFFCSDGTTEYTVSASLSGNAWQHVVFQKSGSELQSWLNGNKIASSSIALNLNINNGSNLLIGGDSALQYAFSGSLDELRIYRQALTSNQIQSLANNDYKSGSAYNSNVVGNVFYEQGIAVISSPFPKHQNVCLGDGAGFYTGSFILATELDEELTTEIDEFILTEDDFDLGFDFEFRSSVKHTEFEYLCQISETDFNFTTNPTIFENEAYQDAVLKSFVSSSEWSPYITTIGLYDDFGQLLAIGKLARPVKKRKDVPYNFIVRFDT
jgi:hypothetical protein